MAAIVRSSGRASLRARSCRASCALLVLAALAAPATSLAETPPITLPDGRGLDPAGTMVAAGDFPAAALMVPGYGVLVDTTGSQINQLEAFNAQTLASEGAATPVGAISTNAAFWAQTGHLALAPDGATLYAAGGATESVDSFELPPVGPPLQTGTISTPGFAGGVAVSRDGSHIFVTVPFDSGSSYDKGSRLVRLGTAGAVDGSATTGSVPWDLTAGMARGRELVITADRDGGTVSVFDAGTLALIRRIAVGRSPAAPTLTPDGTLLVLSTLDDTLSEVDPVSGRALGSLRLSQIPNALGSEPSALALSSDGHSVYVALSADNALAVVHRSAAGALSLVGRIPTAIYPTAIAIDSADHQLLVTSGKGTGQEVGVPAGLPVPASPPIAPGSTGLGVSGAVEAIAIPDASTLAAYTAQVATNNRVPSSRPGATCRQRSPSAKTAGSPAPGVTHVLYVIRENKTYDEQFGDEPGGLPAYVMYPGSLTPNAHALAERFGLLESFYAPEEVSDTGHQVLMGSVASDWVQRLSQQAYGLDGAPRQGAELGNGSDALWSPGAYLLDDALKAGISFRDYGEFYRQDQSQNGPAVTPALDSHIVHDFPGFGFAPDVPDTRRIAFWQNQFARDVANHTFPALEILYLPEDHTTQGLSATPQQQVADADKALGQLIDTVSHSPYWASTAIFMSEDDPQSGLDHVNEHRTIGLVVSPWAKPGQQVTEHLDQTGMLKTVEELLGLPPLTEHDADAHDFANLFTTSPDRRPFSTLTATVPVISAAARDRMRAAARAAIPAGTSLGGIPPGVQARLTAYDHAQAPPALTQRWRRPPSSLRRGS